MDMRAEWTSRDLHDRSPRPWLLLLSLGIAVLLLTLPLWMESAWGAAAPPHSATAAASLTPGTLAGGGQAANAPLTAHCVSHCAPQVVLAALLLCGTLAPRARSPHLATTRFHARLGLAPLLRPPQTR